MEIRDDRRPATSRDPLPAEPPPGRDGPAWPAANAIKHGIAPEFAREGEDAESVLGRSFGWYQSFGPQNQFQAWVVDQISVVTIRLERAERIERRLRDRAAARAGLFWDDDRRLAAEALGARLADRPAATVNSLKRTPQGCDWLLDRWARLARIADQAGGWDATESDLARNLLGHPAGPESPGQAIDLDGRILGPPPEPAALARREVAALLARRAEVAESDRHDRALAESDLADPADPEFLRNRRYVAHLQARLRWLVHQLQSWKKAKTTDYRVAPYFEIPPKPEPKPAPLPEPAAAPVAEREDDPLIGGETLPLGNRRERRACVATSRRSDPARKRDRRPG